MQEKESLELPASIMAGDAIDVRFRVPQVHRLRFTTDLLGDDSNVLTDVIERDDIASATAVLCCDSGVAAARPEITSRIAAICSSAGAPLATGTQIIPGGEAAKNDPAVVGQLLQRINAAGLDRRSYVIAVGGGAVLDAVGYAATIAHRGVRLIRVPTTTLAQADSAVGVKNGVNRFGKKNWEGCFATPWAVINDLGLLQTLSDRDHHAGFSEAVKVALLKSPEFFAEIATRTKEIRGRDAGIVSRVIRQSALWHLAHITEGGDPFESELARPLDFGHWAAHRLEALSGFDLRHGEAVAIGLAIDVAYSEMAHGLPAADADLVQKTLVALGLPTKHDLLNDAPALLEGLEEFRQHLGGRLTVTMLTGLGQPIDVHEIDPRLMRTAIGRVATD